MDADVPTARVREDGTEVNAALYTGEGRVPVSVSMEFARDGFGMRVCYRMDDAESECLNFLATGPSTA